MSKTTAVKAVLQLVAYLATAMALNLALASFTPMAGWVAAALGAVISAILWFTVAPIVAPTWFPFPKPRKGSKP